VTLGVVNKKRAGRASQMSLVTRASIAGIGIVAAGLMLPGRAVADAGPGEDPCNLAVSFFCRFVPIAPDLDGDVDMTKQLPPVDPGDPAPATPPPTDICLTGCI
jgi:hypothetical protein